MEDLFDDHGYIEANFLSWEQADSIVIKQLQEMADKMIMADIRKQNEFQLGILKETPHL